MTEIDKKAVGQRIQSIRLSIGMNKEEFAKLFDSTGSLVKKWEEKEVMPKPSRLLQIAFFGQISVDELLYGKDPCVWEYDGLWDYYSSSCGLDWQMSNPNGFEDNNMNYCPKCGKELQLRE